MSYKPEYKYGAVLNFRATVVSGGNAGNNLYYRSLYIPTYRGDLSQVEQSLGVKIVLDSLCLYEVTAIDKVRPFTIHRRILTRGPNESYAAFKLNKTPKWYLTTTIITSYGTDAEGHPQVIFISNKKPVSTINYEVAMSYIGIPLDEAHYKYHYLYNAVSGCELTYEGALVLDGRTKEDLKERMQQVAKEAVDKDVQHLRDIIDHLQSPTTFEGEI